MEELSKEESDFLRKEAKCPKCKGNLLEGPKGGLSVNVKCEKCGQRYNVPPRPFNIQILKD